MKYAATADNRLRVAVVDMFRAEAMICVACGLVMAPEDKDMLAAHESPEADSEARECLTLPVRRALLGS